MSEEIVLLAIGLYLALGLAWNAFDDWLGRTMEAGYDDCAGYLTPNEREQFKRIVAERATASRAALNISLWPVEFGGYVWFHYLRPGRAK